MEIRIVLGDITIANCDAIVNAANRSLLPGTGVCGSIFEAAGIYRLEEECHKIGHCDTGSAVITSAYKLRSRYIIHAVGPVYRRSEDDPKLLASAYKSSLELAKEYNLKTIAFPAISTGVYGYPIKEATKIALETIDKYGKEYGLDIVYCYCFNEKDYNVYLDTYSELFNNK